MAKAKKVATIKFSEDGVDGLADVLKGMIGRHFEYVDQDGRHFVELMGVHDSGLATLIDRNKKTGDALRNALPYTVSLYDDGVLTYL